MQIYLNVKQVAARFGVDTCTIWRKLKSDPTFPKPKRFGPQTLRWSVAELEAWEVEQ